MGMAWTRDVRVSQEKTKRDENREFRMVVNRRSGWDEMKNLREEKDNCTRGECYVLLLHWDIS